MGDEGGDERRSEAGGEGLRDGDFGAVRAVAARAHVGGGQSEGGEGFENEAAALKSLKN